MPFDPLSDGPLEPFLDPEIRRLGDAARRFAGERIRSRPVAESDPAARTEARELVKILGDGGWSRHAVPAEASASVSVRALCRIREALAHASPLADAVFALQGLGSMPLVLSDNAAMRERWLPRVASGNAMAAFAMTEPDAGSDVGAISTTARREGDEYVLDGRKWLISNAGIADFYTVFASTDPPAGSRGLSCFVVPADAPGLRFVGPQVLSEPHPLGELAFEGCRVPGECRLGEEGRGLRLGLAALDRLRPTVAAAACGLAARALEEATAHVRRRRQFGKALSEQPLVQQKLARMSTDLVAARLLTMRAAHAADTGEGRFTLEAAQAKLFATEAAQRIVDDAVQLHGGLGALASSTVDRLYRSVRSLRIYEGTSEIQHLVIAREMLRDD